MILVDSSVWIDYLQGTPSAQTERLDTLLGRQHLAIGGLILAEVLQGIPHERQFRQAQSLFSRLHLVQICGQQVAVESAGNYRKLRQHGITVRKTIDCLIATRCILDHLMLLHNDRDFDPFVTHLGLHSVFPPTPSPP